MDEDIRMQIRPSIAKTIIPSANMPSIPMPNQTACVFLRFFFKPKIRVGAVYK